jgi:uridine monophosphate synthetase
MGAEVWGPRWDSAGGLAKRWMEACVAKQSLVVLAADRYTMDGLTSLLNEVSKSVVALKTHVDLVVDWTASAWAEFCEAAHSQGMLIFEDRKFADIGKISRDQMGGVYDIRSWADLVTAHLISGPDIVAGLQAGWNDVEREGGVLLLAQMSSRGNLLDEGYTGTVVAAGKENDGVFGFIGNGSQPEGLRQLRKQVGNKMIWTPGVNLEIGDGEMGQRYGDPYEAVLAGSDGIIVGSGIHRANDPSHAARAYADASWKGLLERN